jgi:Flp pilus assembly protein TadG
MWKVLFRARRSYARNQRGNVAVIFAFSAIPLLGLLGGAADVARYTRHKQAILNAMDSAGIALVRRGAKNDGEADRFVNDHIGAMLPKNRDPMLQLARFDATDIGDGYRVSATGNMDTAFMPLIGIRNMPLDLQSEVMKSDGKYEIALALDNTGSMARNGRIQALRAAAGQLVTDLYSKEGAEDRVKMALVPFVTAVNIKSKTPGVFDYSWINPVGETAVFGRRLTRPTNRLELFTKMHANWAGCVEARAEGDEQDTEPTTAATRWVPYLWADEPSGYGNDYITQGGNGGKGKKADADDPFARYEVASVPDRKNLGPNAACPEPIVELTNDRSRMETEIAKMVPHNLSGGNHSGTNVAQGLVWAWRVLSPEAPFQEGAPYSDKTTTKVLVILSDGRNQMVDQKHVGGSDYTSFGYLAEGRLGSKTDYLKAEQAVDEKMKRVCANAKKEGIRIYTILFQVDEDKTKDLFRDCASPDPKTGEPLFFYVPKPELLAGAFNEIGKDLTEIRISR